LDHRKANSTMFIECLQIAENPGKLKAFCGAQGLA